MSNLRRELVYQKTKCSRLQSEIIIIIGKLRGQYPNFIAVQNLIEKFKREISQVQQEDDARRNRKLRKLKSSVPLKSENFNRVTIHNETGIPIPEDIYSLLQFGPGRGIGNSNFGTKVPVEINKLFESFERTARESGISEDQIALIKAHCIFTNHNLKTCLTDDTRAKKLVDFQKAHPELVLLQVDKSKDLILTHRKSYHEKLRSLFSDSSKFAKVSEIDIFEQKTRCNTLLKNTIKTNLSKTTANTLKPQHSIMDCYGTVKLHKNGAPVRPICIAVK